MLFCVVVGGERRGVFVGVCVGVCVCVCVCVCVGGWLCRGFGWVPVELVSVGNMLQKYLFLSYSTSSYDCSLIPYA